MAGALYLSVAVQLVGGFFVRPDGGTHDLVAIAGIVSGVCAFALIAFVHPWASRSDKDLDPELLEARRMAQLRGFGLVGIAAITVLGAGALAAGYGDFMAGSATLMAWAFGLIMLSLGGPSAVLAWCTDQG